jgi:hypothetical protein
MADEPKMMAGTEKAGTRHASAFVIAPAVFGRSRARHGREGEAAPASRSRPSGFLIGRLAAVAAAALPPIPHEPAARGQPVAIA